MTSPQMGQDKMGRRACALRLIDEGRANGTFPPENRQVDNIRILLPLMKEHWTEPELTEDTLRHSLKSLQTIDCPDPASCTDHTAPRVTDFSGNNVFIHGSTMLCEKARESCFSGENIKSKPKSSYQGRPIAHGSDGRLRRPSSAIAAATTSSKRRRSYDEGDVVRVRRFTTTDASTVNRSATATPTASDYNRGGNVANSPSFVSTPSSAYHMAVDGGDAVVPSRPHAQHDDRIVQADSTRSHVPQGVTNTIGSISNAGIHVLMRSAYDQLQMLTYDICRLTNTRLLPRQILMGQSSNPFVNQLVLSLFNTDARPELSNWRKSRIQRAGSLPPDRGLCAMIGAMVHCILLPGVEREHLPVKFSPEFLTVIESVKRIVSAPYLSSQELRARLDAVPVPATFEGIVELEAVKLSVQAMDIADEVAPVLPSWGPLDIGEMDKWEPRLRVIFSRMLVLKVRLEICYSTYRIIWPNRGGPMDRSEMERIEPSDNPLTPQEVAFPCFPGVETRAPGYAPIVARHALVEIINRRTLNEAELSRVIADARNVA
ncbi:hypothetical protein MBLNU457_g2868t1 [Dothideomycetes sp. NU457]